MCEWWCESVHEDCCCIPTQVTFWKMTFIIKTVVYLRSYCMEEITKPCSVAKPCLTLRDPMNCSMPEQHARLPCPSLSPRVCSNSCPLSRWFHPTISSSVFPFSCPQSFPGSESFLQWVSSSYQVAKVLGVSASASVLPMNIQSWFPLGLTGLISMLSKGLSRLISNTTVQKSINSLVLTLLYGPTLTSILWLLGKTVALTVWTFVGKVMSLLFNRLSSFVIAFLPRYKPQLSLVAAAAAKSLQSCPTLCDPIDGNPPGFPVLGILQARTLEWVAISFSNAWKWKVKVKSPSRVRLFGTPWTAAYQAPLSMGFSRQEYWSGVHCLLQLSLRRWVILDSKSNSIN